MRDQLQPEGRVRIQPAGDAETMGPVTTVVPTASTGWVEIVVVNGGKQYGVRVECESDQATIFDALQHATTTITRYITDEG